MFSHVITRRPSRSICDGITSNPGLGRPDYENALRQHAEYVRALGRCGVEVVELPPLEEFPDSCFVEDTAVVTRACAVISRPGADTRRGESTLMVDTIKRFYPEDKIEYIEAPGTMEGGDVMMVGDHFYIGLSARTNAEGGRQLIEALEKHGLSGEIVPLSEVLHLKTGLAYLENNNLLVAGEFCSSPLFGSFNRIEVKPNEAYGANCIYVNGHVLVPLGYPETEANIRVLGCDVITVDTSEFRKIDGGLSCLSLRF